MCGMGVTSRIDFTSMPTVWIARIADSRPDPGPFTRTSSDRMPTVLATLPAASAAWVAANGVPLREPLKPMPPALEQLEQRDAGNPARALGRLEVSTKLIFEDAVDALDLLLLAQLQAVAGQLRLPRLAVLPGREVTLLDRALLRVAALALEIGRASCRERV